MKSFKRLLILSGIIVFLVSIVNASLFAQTQGQRPQQSDRGSYEWLKPEKIDELAEKLSLDKSQSKEVEKILSDSQEKIDELKDKQKELQQEMQELYRQQSPDRELMVEKSNEMSKTYQDITQIYQEMVKKVKEILKDEQKEKLDDLLDPALLWRMKSIRDALKLEEDESAIMPLVRKILKCEKNFNTEYQPKIGELRSLIGKEDEKEIETKLGEVKEILAKYNTDRKKLEDELRPHLTPKQEAILIIQGVQGVFNKSQSLEKPSYRMLNQE